MCVCYVCVLYNFELKVRLISSFHFSIRSIITV